jgi:hypothetical protein
MKRLDGTVNSLFVIPAKAGIQPFLNSWIPARASYRQLGRNDDPFPFQNRIKSENPP